MTVIKGRLGAVYMAQIGAGTTALTNEATTANAAKTVFTIADEAKRFLDPDTAVVIDYPDNATPVTSYASIQRPGGIVTWAATPGDGDVFITGKYLPVAVVGECKSWTLDFATEFVDVTSFGDTFKRQVAMITQGTANIEGFYVDETLFNEMISTNPRIGVDLFVDSTAGYEIRYTGFGTLGSTSISASIDGVVEQPFVVNFNDGPYYVAGLA